MNFNSVLIGSADAPALAAYYTKLLGEPGFHEGDYTGWMIGSGFITVGPHSEVTGKSTQPGRIIQLGRVSQPGLFTPPGHVVWRQSGCVGGWWRRRFAP